MSAILNQKLLKKNKVTEAQEEKLYKLYEELDNIFKQDKTLDASNKEQAKTLVLELENLEFELQKNWNFPQSVNFHTYWSKLSNCSCPKLDNQERIGTGQRITVGDCIYHGFD